MARLALLAIPFIGQVGSFVFSLEGLFYATIGALPALFWLTFFLVEDRKHPEPKKIISYVFIAGAASALLSLVVQLILRAYLVPHLLSASSVPMLVMFATIEEISKFLFVYWAIRKSKYFDEPVDGMIYMITGAMGFAALENILFLISAGSNLAGVLIFRFIGAILLHAIASGLIGFYWLRKKLTLGLMAAIALHSIFNVVVLGNEFGVVIAPFILVLSSLLLFRDFGIAKREGGEE